MGSWTGLTQRQVEPAFPLVLPRVLRNSVRGYQTKLNAILRQAMERAGRAR
jgi:hypothetical protein